MSKRKTRALVLDLVTNLIAAALLGGMAWGASEVESDTWALWSVNLAGGSAACLALALVAAIRLFFRWCRGK